MTEAMRDVVICGGGLAGLLLARQIRRELPTLSVTVLERTRRPLPDACHKVGESCVEVASQYMARLGLHDYLLRRHIVKLGLRFFPGRGDLPLHERIEIGAGGEPIVRSFQLDRGRLETDLRSFVEEDGVDLVEGARVRAITLGTRGAPHCVTCTTDRGDEEFVARWVIDATGRSGIIRRDLKLKRGTSHVASAGWFRIAGRFDINDMVPDSETAWHARPFADQRWRSTNHFMGPGYWAWVIPLATGHTSIGLVVHEEQHDFRSVSSLDAVRAFLHEHEPHLAQALAGSQVEDFLCLRNYSNAVSRCWSPDRWAIVGEAGAFVDPLYSPGSDFIAFANCFTTRMLQLDQSGADLQAQASAFNRQYRVLVASTIELFRTAAPVYGHVQAMAAKLYWDNFTYWSYTCQYFQQSAWTLPPHEHDAFDVVGRRFVEHGGHMHALLRNWAELAPSINEPIMRPIPAFPSLLVDAHIAVGQSMTREEGLAYVRERAEQGREIVIEVLLRAVQELGPDAGRELLNRAHYRDWQLTIPPERLDLEDIEHGLRHDRLSAIARDVELNLGPMRRHPAAEHARRLLSPTAVA